MWETRSGSWTSLWTTRNIDAATVDGLVEGRGLLRRIDYVGNPVDRQRDPVIDAGLAALRARVTGRHDTDQIPSARLLHHQRSARIALQTTSISRDQ